MKLGAATFKSLLRFAFSQVDAASVISEGWNNLNLAVIR